MKFIHSLDGLFFWPLSAKQTTAPMILLASFTISVCLFHLPFGNNISHFMEIYENIFFVRCYFPFSREAPPQMPDLLSGFVPKLDV
jgi:hypothetical protein